MRILPILAASCFVSSMSMRIMDPVVPDVARDFSLPPETVAMLATAFAFPYALGQPVLGALADALGKSKIIKTTLAVLVVCLAFAYLAPTFDTLFAARIVGGAAAGGIIPIAFAMIGDRFEMADRQWALSRVLTAIIAGQMTGSIGSGIVASHLGWRASVLAATALSGAALVVTLWKLRPRPKADRSPFRLATLFNGYAEVFANPRAVVCFSAVFIEGIIIFGAIPFVAVLLEQRGAGGLQEAGFVLAGFAIGGFCYIALVRVLLRTLGVYNLIRAGGIVAGLGFATMALQFSWPLEAMVFFVIGLGFYMIHNSLQTQATELAPRNRASAVAAHAFFFFLGQAAGPIVYRLGFASAGVQATLVVMGIAFAAVGLATAAGLIRRSPMPQSHVTS
jgi:predicted MFS family arabinose efflux permease